MEVKKETDVKYVHYGDIHTNIADEIDKNNNLPFINEIYKEYDELKLDDVIVADASEDYKGIADAAVIISNLPYTIIAGLHTIALRPTSLIKGYFLYHIFKTENFKRFGYKIGTGLKVFGISYNNLAKYKVYYPQEIEEQEKIIGILSNLTNSINLHERKCEELALIKKALLQKLFPKKDEIKPEVRYKNFSDAWEQRKLGDLAEIVRGASPRPISDPKWFDDNSDIGWLRISDVTNQNGRIYYLEQHISKLGQEKTRVITEPHLLLSIAATVGKPLINYIKTGVHDGFLIFLNPKFDLEYMYQWLEMFRPKWNKYGQPGSQVNLNSNLVRKQKIALPSREEQQRISSFLKQLDSLIALHQRKLEKLKQLKKFLLQNMFI